VVVEILYNELYKIFVQELININIGHLPDKKALLTMNELINAIDYIEHGNPTNNEIILWRDLMLM
jgi:hypothetical protein